MTGDMIDAFERDILAIINAKGSEIPLQQLRFRNQAGEAAMKVLRPYQVLPAAFRRYRIEKRRPDYKDPEQVVRFVSMDRPSDWVRPLALKQRTKLGLYGS